MLSAEQLRLTDELQLLTREQNLLSIEPQKLTVEPPRLTRELFLLNDEPPELTPEQFLLNDALPTLIEDFLPSSGRNRPQAAHSRILVIFGRSVGESATYERTADDSFQLRFS